MKAKRLSWITALCAIVFIGAGCESTSWGPRQGPPPVPVTQTAPAPVINVAPSPAPNVSLNLPDTVRVVVVEPKPQPNGGQGFAALSGALAPSHTAVAPPVYNGNLLIGTVPQPPAPPVVASPVTLTPVLPDGIVLITNAPSGNIYKQPTGTYRQQLTPTTFAFVDTNKVLTAVTNVSNGTNWWGYILEDK